MSEPRLSRARSNWALLGSPAALSWPVPVLATAFCIIGPLTIDRQRIGGPISSWLLSALIAQTVLIAIVLGCRPIVGRSPWRTMLVLAVASIGRGVALALSAWMLGLTASPEFGYRVGPAAVATFGVLVALALAVSSYQRHRAVAAELAAKQAGVLDLTNALLRRREEAQLELTEEVHLSIDPLIADIDRQLNLLAQGGDASPALETIRRLVDDELRPLSHRLAEPIPVVLPPAASISAMGATRIPLPRQLPLRRLVDPFAIGILAGIVSSSQSLRTPNLATAIAFPALTGLLAAGFAAVVALAIGRWQPRLWLGVAITALIGGAGLSLALVIQQSIGVPVPPFVQSAGVFVGIVIGVVTALFLAVDARRSATETELRESIVALEDLAGVLRQHEHAARRHLSHLLHGTIQGTLHSAAIRLASQTAWSPELIGEIRADIDAAMSQLDDPRMTAVRIIDTFTDIAELWDGTCTVHWTLDHQTLHLVVMSPSTAISAVDITRECVTNAIKHGRATEVWITIARSGDRVIISALDNGTSSASGAPGLGSRLLDAACATWRREPSDSGTRVTAELAVVTP